MRRYLIWGLVFLLVTLCSLPALAEKSRYRATLTGKHEVPRVKTAATGDLKLTVFEDGVSFELNVTGVMNPVAAYIHRGKKGQNGPPVAGLFGGPPKKGEFSGVLAQGKITDQSLLGELQGKRVADLLRLVTSGQAYVNVTTGTFPDGEIRGQIK